MTEFELKFQVDAERVAAVEKALRRGTVQRTRLKARYFDTPDEALARRQLVLRLRQEGRHWVQAAKGPADAAFHRLEHEVRVAGGADAVPDPALHDEHPVGALLRKALKDSGQALQLAFETDVTRLTRLIEASGTTVEIALDRGQILAAGRRQPVQELEFELKQGSPAAAVQLAQSWCEEYGLWLDPLSKSATGQRLARGETAGPPVQAKPLRSAGKSASTLVAGVLASALQQILGNARELAAGMGGDDHIHQLRVGLRRLRTSLRELHVAPGLQSLEPLVEPQLRALFDLLGQHRDRSTLVPALEREIAAAGGPKIEWRPRLPDVGAAIRAPELQVALLQLVAFAQDLQTRPAQAGDSLKATRKAVRAQLARLHRQVEREGLRFEALTQPQRHRVRKRLKRLRYLAELTLPLFDRREVDRFTQALKGLQDALGRYQDAAAGHALFAQRAAEDPNAWFGAGWLAAREQQIAAECAAACRKTAAKARPFWK